jgi:membrane-bound lytic murein transglycosylase D
VNEIAAGDPPAAGDELVIPVATAAGRAQRYTARRGDTLVTVADRFGVAVEDLRAWNHLSSNKLTPGRALFVSEPVRLAPTARAKASHGHVTTPHGRAAGGSTGSSHGAHVTPAASHTKTATVQKRGSTSR